MVSFNPASASRIIKASRPVPAITAKCSPFIRPTSSRRREPFSPTATASSRSFGMPRFVAKRLAVPAGRMARATGAPATASMTRWTVPSPPHTKIRSAPFFTSLRARSGASLLFGTSYHIGSLIPWVASVLRSSSRPPPSVFAECAITPTEVKAGPRRGRRRLDRPAVGALVCDRAGRSNRQQREQQGSDTQHDAPHDVRGVVHTPIEASEYLRRSGSRSPTIHARTRTVELRTNDTSRSARLTYRMVAAAVCPDGKLAVGGAASSLGTCGRERLTTIDDVREVADSTIRPATRNPSSRQ